MKFFKQHGINLIWGVPNLIVPKLKNINEFYRMSFDQQKDEDFNQEVKKIINKPDEKELFGTTSGEDQDHQATQSAPKKRKVNHSVLT